MREFNQPIVGAVWPASLRQESFGWAFTQLVSCGPAPCSSCRLGITLTSELESHGQPLFKSCRSGIPLTSPWFQPGGRIPWNNSYRSGGTSTSPSLACAASSPKSAQVRARLPPLSRRNSVVTFFDNSPLWVYIVCLETLTSRGAHVQRRGFQLRKTGAGTSSVRGRLALDIMMFDHDWRVMCLSVSLFLFVSVWDA